MRISLRWRLTISIYVLKIGRAGYRVLYTPHAVLYHHEAFSKTSKDLIPHPDEVAAMRSKWSGVIAHDPLLQSESNAKR